MRIDVKYFGRTSEFLLMTSEKMSMPDEIHTVEQVLLILRKRGSRWAYELDDSHVICTINCEPAMLSGTIDDGDEIGVFSSKSIFEM